MRFGDRTVRFLYFVFAASLFIGCSKWATRMDRLAATRLHPEEAVLFFIDELSHVKCLAVEAKIIHHLSRALEDRVGNIRVVSSKEFRPDAAEPFYSSEDITRLLQDTQFNKRFEAERMHDIVLADVEARHSDWYRKSKSNGGDGGGHGAIYCKRDMEHVKKAAIISRHASPRLSN